MNDNTSVDLISREALKKDLTSETRDKFEFVCLNRVLEKIDKAPTVKEISVIEFKEPLPLVKAQKIVKALSKRPEGEWKTFEGYDGDEYYECSICGEPWFLEAGTPKDNNMNFCPNCGAYMKGGEVDG